MGPLVFLASPCACRRRGWREATGFCDTLVEAPLRWLSPARAHWSHGMQRGSTRAMAMLLTQSAWPLPSLVPTQSHLIGGKGFSIFTQRLIVVM